MIRVSKYKALDVVPGPGSSIRHPLTVFPSLHRVLRDQFPGFISTMRVLRLPVARPTALRFLRLVVPRLHSLCSLLDGRVQPPKPGVVHPVTPAGNLPRRRQDLPSSWRTPMIRLHMFFDSGRTACTRPIRSSSMAPASETAKAPCELSFSELNSMAFGLAAGTVRSMVGFAGLVTQPPRKTRFRSLVRRYRTGFHPQGSNERFQSCLLTSHPPFPSLAWRNPENPWEGGFDF